MAPRNSTTKIKLLFFVTEFWQAGTQRFTYEVDKAIDKNKFEISILSYRKLNTIKGKDDFYYEKHIELGTKIFFLSDFIETKSLFEKVLPVFKNQQKRLKDFLKSFDVISFMGEYSYKRIKNVMSDSDKKKSLIHIMNSKHQNPHIYDEFDKNAEYTFCSGFLEDEAKSELWGFTKYRHIFFPLSVKVENSEPLWMYSRAPPKKIGIFTRLTHTKPIDPFLYAFHLLLHNNPDLELHIFGDGDPEKSGVAKYAKHLNIETKVKFRGHQDDLKKAALEETLSLVWFHSYYGVPGGFAGFDICSLGIPQLFWNFTPDDAVKPNDAFPVYNKLLDFTAHSRDIIENKEKAEALSNSQFHAFLETRDINKFINSLESTYFKLFEEKSKEFAK
jgi:glycosyltransferase involved in cell wall biosynthesis